MGLDGREEGTDRRHLGALDEADDLLTSAGSASRPKIIGPWMALGTKIPAPIRGARDATPITKDSSGIGRRPCTEAAVPTRTVRGPGGRSRRGATRHTP